LSSETYAIAMAGLCAALGCDPTETSALVNRLANKTVETHPAAVLASVTKELVLMRESTTKKAPVLNASPAQQHYAELRYIVDMLIADLLKTLDWRNDAGPARSDALLYIIPKAQERLRVLDTSRRPDLP
jgi:hypothetical protein